MFRTARITFAEPGGPVRTLTAQVFHDPAHSPFWQDDAAAAAVVRRRHIPLHSLSWNVTLYQ